MKYECPCGYIYDPEVGDPEGGIAAGTAWEDIPEDWVCPVCGLGALLPALPGKIFLRIGSALSAVSERMPLLPSEAER